MAITKLQTQKYIDNVESGLTCQTQKPVNPGVSMPIYIPKLMPYISKGTPRTSSVVTNGNMIFVNDVSCKPNAPMVVQTQNYISPKFASNGTWIPIIDDPDEDLVPAGTSVNVTFTSGNILNPTFNTK